MLELGANSLLCFKTESKKSLSEQRSGAVIYESASPITNFGACQRENERGKEKLTLFVVDRQQNCISTLVSRSPGAT